MVLDGSANSEIRMVSAVGGEDLVNLSLRYDPSFQISEALLRKAIAQPAASDRVLLLLIQRSPDLGFGTELLELAIDHSAGKEAIASIVPKVIMTDDLLLRAMCKPTDALAMTQQVLEQCGMYISAKLYACDGLPFEPRSLLLE